MRMLICDDNVDNADSLAILLRSHGHEVKVFYNGRTCLEATMEWKPAVAFLDIGMPEVTGYGVARKLRESFGAEVLLAAISGYDDAHQRAAALASGFDVYLTKPASFERLLAIASAWPAGSGDATA